MGLLPSVTALCERALRLLVRGVDGVGGDGFDVCKHVGCADCFLDFEARVPRGLTTSSTGCTTPSAPSAAVAARAARSPPWRRRRAAAVAARRRL